MLPTSNSSGTQAVIAEGSPAAVFGLADGGDDYSAEFFSAEDSYLWPFDSHDPINAAQNVVLKTAYHHEPRPLSPYMSSAGLSADASPPSPASATASDSTDSKPTSGSATAKSAFGHRDGAAPNDTKYMMQDPALNESAWRAAPMAAHNDDEALVQQPVCPSTVDPSAIQKSSSTFDFDLSVTTQLAFNAMSSNESSPGASRSPSFAQPSNVKAENELITQDTGLGCTPLQASYGMPVLDPGEASRLAIRIPINHMNVMPQATALPSPHAPSFDFSLMSHTAHMPIPDQPFAPTQAWPGFPMGSAQISQGTLPPQYPPVSSELQYSYSPLTSRPPSPSFTVSVKGTSEPVKSRVETQIDITLQISPLPAGIRRLRFPRHTISKSKLLAKPPADPSPDMLELHTMLVCTSAMQNADVRGQAMLRASMVAQPAGSQQVASLPGHRDLKPQEGGEVFICENCMARERKRAARKKKRGEEDEAAWQKYEAQRVVVFNASEIKEWQQVPKQGSHPVNDGAVVEAPMRIACYCRHVGEKSGFQVIFTLTDSRGHLVAQAMSRSIMITDDHKATTFSAHVPSTMLDTSDPAATHVLKTSVSSAVARDGQAVGTSARPLFPAPGGSDMYASKRNSVTAVSPSAPSHAATDNMSALPAAPSLSRPASPTSLPAPSSKKRKPNGSSRTHADLAMTMTRLDTGRLNSSPPSNPSTAAGYRSASTSPFSPARRSFRAGPDQLFSAGGQDVSSPQTSSLTNGSPHPMASLPTGPDRSGSVDSIVDNWHMAVTTAHTNHLANPNGMMTAAPASFPTRMPQDPLTQALVPGLYPATPNPAAQEPSAILKVIPAEGPKNGGVEVTILGAGFIQGMEIMFGGKQATTTTYWGPTSLVCLLPPAEQAGIVPVTLKGEKGFSPSPAVFRYFDDNENQLMRMAFRVLGNSFGGFGSVSELARRIIGNDMNHSNPLSQEAEVPGSGPGSMSFSRDMDTDFEMKLLQMFKLMDSPESLHRPRLNERRKTGQTMLHLACALGLHRVVVCLLERGASVDPCDKGGYTPLHMAALNNHVGVVRLLLSYRSDPTMQTLSGLTATDVSRSNDVHRALKRTRRHARTRSGGSLFSRTSSFSSIKSSPSRASSFNGLKSLWEPLSTLQRDEALPSTEVQSGEESAEYSSLETERLETDDESDDDDDDDVSWMGRLRDLSKGCKAAGLSSGDKGTSSHQSTRSTDDLEPLVQTGTGSSAAAVAVLTEQIAAHVQQFQQKCQQTLALHFPNFQNLSHLASLPQMPNIPPLPDNQALQWLASMVPNIGGTRPDAADPDEQRPSAKELQSRLWDLTSAPPSYDDLFPAGREDLDLFSTDREKVLHPRIAAAATTDVTWAARLEAKGEMSMPGPAPVASSFVHAEASSSHKAPSPRELPELLQIGRNDSITVEQRENLRRAHAERLKKIRADRKLFFVWIPLLVTVFIAMTYPQILGAWGAVVSCLESGGISSRIATTGA